MSLPDPILHQRWAREHAALAVLAASPEPLPTAAVQGALAAEHAPHLVQQALRHLCSRGLLDAAYRRESGRMKYRPFYTITEAGREALARRHARGAPVP